MKYAKYSGAVICAILALGTLPSIYFIGSGLALGSVSSGDELWFSTKFVLFVAWVVVLAYGSYRLWRSAKASQP